MNPHPTHTPHPPHTHTTTSARPSTLTHDITQRVATLLMVLAALLAGACVLRAASLVTRPAHAEMVSNIAGELTTMTVDGGSEDILLVLDNRTERLLVYKTGSGGMELFTGEPLRELFTRAKASFPQ